MSIDQILSDNDKEILNRHTNYFGDMGKDYLDEFLLCHSMELDVKEYALLRMCNILSSIENRLKEGL